VGLPGTGKTTYIREHMEEFRGYTILSLDELVEQRLAEIQKSGRAISMNQIWGNRGEIKKLRALHDIKLREAIAQGENILIDASLMIQRHVLIQPALLRRLQILLSINSYSYSSTRGRGIHRSPLTKSIA
jgi:predicted kinase